MQHAPNPAPDQQRVLLDRWITSLAQLPAIDVVWLEGSLAAGRANPWSDVDLRIAIADDAHPHLWEADRLPLLQGIGDHLLLLNDGWLRAVTADGIIVELLAYKSSATDSLALYEWQILLNRLPPPRPTFQRLPEQSTAETWPAPAWSSREVAQWTKEIIHQMAVVAADFHRREVCATAYELDFLRSGLFRLMYQRLGIRFSKRAKELSQIFPAEFISDLRSTYTQDAESPLSLPALAAAQIRTFAAFEKHLSAISAQLGGGFEPEWYRRIYEKMESDLRQFIAVPPTPFPSPSPPPSSSPSRPP